VIELARQPNTSVALENGLNANAGAGSPHGQIRT
jgi:hypothetical protein